jgi:hypothetical protein
MDVASCRRYSRSPPAAWRMRPLKATRCFERRFISFADTKDERLKHADVVCRLLLETGWTSYPLPWVCRSDACSCCCRCAPKNAHVQRRSPKVPGLPSCFLHVAAARAHALAMRRASFHGDRRLGQARCERAGPTHGAISVLAMRTVLHCNVMYFGRGRIASGQMSCCACHGPSHGVVVHCLTK